MKKIVCSILTISLIFLISGCSGQQYLIVDNSDKSYFVDFYTSGNDACIECMINIYNSGEDTKAEIYAFDNEDVTIGLLENSLLVGKDKSGSTVFNIKHGENKINIIFTGIYAGVYQITSRSIPRFIYVEKK